MKLPFFGSPEPTADDEGASSPIPEGALVVLMVDDEPAQRQLFAMALRREGYHVLEARNGVEALEVADRAGRLDLVVTDVMMPLMKGPEMATRLRDRFPDLKVVFVSGFVVTEELGPNPYVLQKPFVRQDLIRTVANLIGPGGASGT